MNTSLIDQLNAIPHPSKILVRAAGRDVRLIYHSIYVKEILTYGVAFGIVSVQALGLDFFRIYPNLIGVWVLIGILTIPVLYMRGRLVYTFNQDTSKLTGTYLGWRSSRPNLLPLTALFDFRAERRFPLIPIYLRIVATDGAGKKHNVIEYLRYWDGKASEQFLVKAVQLCGQAKA